MLSSKSFQRVPDGDSFSMPVVQIQAIKKSLTLQPMCSSNSQKKIRYRIVLLCSKPLKKPLKKPLFSRHLDDHSFLLLSLTSLLQSMASRSFCLLCFYSTSILCFRQYKTEQLFYFLSFYDSSYLHKKRIA